MPRRPARADDTVVQAAPELPALLGARAVVVQGEDQGRGASLGAGPLIVGSDPAVGLPLSDRSVSKRHLSLERVGSAVRLRDLGSTNGTFVGGVRVMESLVPVGTMLRVGRTWLHLQGQDGALVLEPAEVGAFEDLVGSSPAMRQLYAVLDRVAPRDVTVLVDGETGTGKELVARALHARSPRKAGPLVVFDCSAVSPELVEAQLFGHRRGAFTGASEDRRGVFEAALGGTLFLDELDSLPSTVQPKLLRALESRRVVRLGEHQERPVDVRVVAAAGRSPEDAVATGTLRRDLYFRLAVVRITLPALRDRLDDLPQLCRTLLDRLGAHEIAVSEGPALQRLRLYGWPGNVRELRNVLERGWALSPRGARDLDALPIQLGGGEAAAMDAGHPEDLPYKVARDRVVAQWEPGYLRAAWERADGNLSETARQVGLSRLHLRRLLRRAGVLVGALLIGCSGCVGEKPGPKPEETATEPVETGCEEEDGWRDDDGDGWGRGSAQRICPGAEGYAPVPGDCDDDDPAIHPLATEIADDVIDENCDGQELCYRDDDEDGARSDVLTGSENLRCSANGVGHSDDPLDCDDGDDRVYPGAPELCGDGKVNDCDSDQATADATCAEATGDAAVNGLGSSLDGVIDNDELGTAVSGRGDLNGDGLADVLVGAPKDSTGAYLGGAAYVAWGPVTVSRSMTMADAVLPCSETYAEAGMAVSIDGDTDGDGYDDLLIAAPELDGDTADVGGALLVLSPVVGLLNLNGADATLAGGPGASAGQGVELGGDVNGDGQGDLLVAGPYDGEWGSRAGAVWLLWGPVMGDRSLLDADATLYGAPGDDAGMGATILGDLDGDGLADVVVGSAGQDDYAGTVRLMYGPVSGVTALEDGDALLTGRDLAQVGPVAAAGDTDGDGLDDLLVGAPGNGPKGSQQGDAYLVVSPPPADMELEDADAIMRGERVKDEAGHSVDNRIDYDGDGHADLLIGAPEAGDDRYDNGRAYLLYSPVLGTIGLEDADVRLRDLNQESALGWAVAGAGDLDGDGLDDLLIGAPREPSLAWAVGHAWTP